MRTYIFQISHWKSSTHILTVEALLVPSEPLVVEEVPGDLVVGQLALGLHPFAVAASHVALEDLDRLCVDAAVAPSVSPIVPGAHHHDSVDGVSGALEYLNSG